MRKIVFATHNQNKVREIRQILGDWEIVSLDDLGYSEDIPETAETLEGNAILKADTIFQRFKMPCFADDTGLEVEALNGAPGVWSARFAGTPANSEQNVEKLLSKLNGEINRSAQFRTVIAYKDSKNLKIFEGIVKGNITGEKRGKNGFGYDPVFCPENFEKTFAELSQQKKNEISHRKLAIQEFIKYLENG